MYKYSFYFISLALFSSFLHAWPITDFEIMEIMNSAKDIEEATLNSNADILVNYMPLKLLSMMGGKDKAMKATNSYMESLKSRNIKIAEYKVSSVIEIFRTSNNDMAILPTYMLLISPKLKVKSKGFLVATRATGEKAWKFIDGAGLKDREKMEAIFPDYPKNKEIPEISVEVVN